MATPTDQQQIRATLRRHAKREGDVAAATLALTTAVDLFESYFVGRIAQDVFPELSRASHALPALMGTAEVAETFGIANSNISKLGAEFRPTPVQFISGGRTPVYLASEVREKAAARRAARGGGDA